MGLLYTTEDVRQWDEFEQGLRERNRYMPTNQAYFVDLIESCLRRRQTLKSGTSLFRSRIMPMEQSLGDEPLNPEEMGPPPPKIATAGRLNPEGISCLYAALEEDTAVA